jgi:hypothetical protein
VKEAQMGVLEQEKRMYLTRFNSLCPNVIDSVFSRDRVLVSINEGDGLNGDCETGMGRHVEMA